MRTPGRLVGVLLAVSALGLTGCSVSYHFGSATTSAPAVTVEAATPTPSPTPMSIEEAGLAYLAMVAAPNAANREFSDACDNDDVKAARAAAAPAAVALRSFGDQVAATAWPATVEPTAKQLLTEIAADLRFFNEVAAAKTDAAAVAIINGYAPTRVAGPAMRSLLGLPDAPAS